MITMYTGLPGSGKSLHLAKTVYYALLDGKNIISNFEINEDYFKRKKASSLGMYVYKPNTFWLGEPEKKEDMVPCVEYLYKYAVEHHKRDKRGHMTEGQTLLILDECQLLFNARSWNAKGRMHWNAFFTEHRKYGYEIYLVTQNENFIDKQVRTLVETIVLHKKVGNYKLFGKILEYFACGKLFVATSYSTQVKGTNASYLGHEFFKGKKFYNFYDSYKIFNNHDNIT